MAESISHHAPTPKKRNGKTHGPQIDIGIPQSDREQIAHGLARVLADTYTLYLKTHYFHWNVTGELFDTLHEMFEQQYKALFEAVDDIAERIRALGEFAPGTPKEFAELAEVRDAQGIPEAFEMMRQLLEDHETAVRTAREVQDLCDKANDQVDVDLMSGRMRFHEKTAWMLRSMLGGP